MISDDELSEILVQSLPEGVRMTCILDACHSGTGLDLPWTYDFKKEKRWVEETNPFHVV